MKVWLRPVGLFCVFAFRVRSWRIGGRLRFFIQSRAKIFNNLHQLLGIGFLRSLFSEFLPVLFLGPLGGLVADRFQGSALLQVLLRALKELASAQHYGSFCGIDPLPQFAFVNLEQCVHVGLLPRSENLTMCLKETHTVLPC